MSSVLLLLITFVSCVTGKLMRACVACINKFNKFCNKNSGQSEEDQTPCLYPSAIFFAVQSDFGTVYTTHPVIMLLVHETLRCSSNKLLS